MVTEITQYPARLCFAANWQNYEILLILNHLQFIPLIFTFRCFCLNCAYSEALQGQENLQPKLDAQKDVYTGILNTLEDAIKNLEKGKDLESAGNQDIAFGNDNEQWMATAYALKARYLLHQLAVTEDKTALLTEVKKAAEKAVELNFTLIPQHYYKIFFLST